MLVDGFIRVMTFGFGVFSDESPGCPVSSVGHTNDAVMARMPTRELFVVWITSGGAVRLLTCKIC